MPTAVTTAQTISGSFSVLGHTLFMTTSLASLLTEATLSRTRGIQSPSSLEMPSAGEYTLAH